MKTRNTAKIILSLLLVAAVGTAVFNIYEARAQSTVAATVKISVCGDGEVGGNEECDKDDLNGETCISKGYVRGTLRCTSGCTFDTSACTYRVDDDNGGVGRGYIPPLVKTKVIIKGKAYPQAEITFLSDGKVERTEKADSSADFRFEITDITSGTYTFSLWAVDSDNRKSITFSFTTNVAKNMTTTVSGIFLPPTIELEKNSFERGEFLNVLGQTAPKSEVAIFIDFSDQEIVRKTKAESNGTWSYSFDTIVLEKGDYTVRAKAESPENLLSSYSEVLSFYVEEEVPVRICLSADLNSDGKVNLVDFSILLYWWESSNACADQNNDGRVNLPDFSIMMYYWTG